MNKVTIDRELLERILPVLDKAAFYKFGDPVTPDSKVANDLRTELLAILAASVPAGCKVVPVESLRRWVTGLQLGIISQRSVVEELRAILEAKDE